MVRLLYNLVWPIGLIFYLPSQLVKMVRRGGYRRDFGQRFGFYRRGIRQQLRGARPIWLHAVSVGEVAIALKLAHQIHLQRADVLLVLTVTTTTGHATAERAAAPWLLVLYAPLDFWPVMRRACRRIQARALVLIEAEIWPNLIAYAKQKRIPIILANARLSLRSERRFQRFRFFLQPTFRKLDLVCVPAEQEAARWQRLAIPEERLRVVGNIKYDSLPHATVIDARAVLNDLGVAPSRPILFGGSTHPGEEQILADAFCCLRRRIPNLFLIIAPRHVERARQIEAQLRSRKLSVTRRTQTGPAPNDCLLIDTTGELAQWYKVATVVFMGKSLTAHGGQNPVEAILARAAVIFGPHMENFAQLASKLIESGGAVCVQNQQQLMDEVLLLLNDARLREERVAAALEVIAPHHGATKRTADLITRLVDAPHGEL